MADTNNQMPNQQNQPPVNYPPPPPPPPTNPNGPNDRKTFAIISMVCGIVSIVLSCAWYIAILAAIVAIVMGCLSLKSSGRKMAIAGIICGSVGALACIVFFVMAIGLAAYSSMSDTSLFLSDSW